MTRRSVTAALRIAVRATSCLPFLAVLAAMPAQAGPARLSAAGEPVPIITNEQRAMLELKFGPDAPIDFFQAKDGNFYLNSSGSLGPVDGPGRAAAWNLRVDPQLTQVLALHGNGPATGPQDVQTLMTTYAPQCGTGRRRLTAGEPGGAACNAYFDRDYAGGGAYYRCPDNETSVLFYHGENHTAPDGNAGHGGWFGIGVAYFDAGETALTRAAQMPVAGGTPSAQIIGLNLPTQWSQQGGGYADPPQDKPYNGVASAVAGADGYLYLYHGDATMDPAYNPTACRPECMGVSRAPVAAFCRSIKSSGPVQWLNYYNGRWTQPAVEGAGSPLGFGSGGPFTPLLAEALPGEHGGTVTYLPAPRLYVMARLYQGGIDVRTSTDGLTWSGEEMVEGAPQGTTANGDAEQLLYPRIVVVHDPRGREHYVLTYALVTKGHFWRWAELMRQPLTLSSQ